jgi:gag-polypeptide of LTR copia-type
MGNLPSLWDEIRSEPTNHREKNHDSVTIKLSCADFGTFNGRSDQWISFKENTLSKAGVGGYAQYFKPDFILTENNREGNNRIFYLLQTATNGGGASHVVRKHAQAADGAGAWKALVAWYEGPVMSGEIAKTLRTKLWAMKLQSKDDVNKHINDFTLYMDQLKELGREEREETLTDLFLDSVIDPKFEVTVANCRLRDHISVHECFEAAQEI